MENIIRPESRTDGWRASTEGRLRELVALPQGWDGYAGLPVSKEVANFAIEMLSAICDSNTPAPQLVPGSSGDVQVEWHYLAGDIELHVLAAHRVDAWFAISSDDNAGISLELQDDFSVVAIWLSEIAENDGGAQSAAA